MRILIIAAKRDLTSEKFLFGSLYLIFSFSYYDFQIMLMIILDDTIPGIHLEYERLPQLIYFQVCILLLGFGLLISLYAMIWMLKKSRAPENIKKWQIGTFSIVLLLLFISTFQSVSLQRLDRYTFVISNNWILDSLLFIASYLIMYLTVNQRYFPFLKKQADLLNINSRRNKGYGILVNLVMSLYAGGIAIRIYFGTTWGIILIADIVFLLSSISTLVLSFFPGFGESLLCVRNMESIYIVHQSGKLIYSRKFFPESTFDEEFFGAFLIIINEITKEIRSTGGRISQIVLEDDSEIIMVKGEFTQGVLITKTYNTLFIKKLRDFVGKIEKTIGSDLQNLSGKRLELDQQIEKLLRDLF